VRHWAGGVAQVVQHLRSKCEALSSNPSTTPTSRRKKEDRVRDYTLKIIQFIGWVHSSSYRVLVARPLVLSLVPQLTKKERRKEGRRRWEGEEKEKEIQLGAVSNIL
jgi:hypothetical protein